MVHDKVFPFLLAKSCDSTFDVKRDFLSFFLSKHQENCNILEL